MIPLLLINEVIFFCIGIIFSPRRPRIFLSYVTYTLVLSQSTLKICKYVVNGWEAISNSWKKPLRPKAALLTGAAHSFRYPVRHQILQRHEGSQPVYLKTLCLTSDTPQRNSSPTYSSGCSIIKKPVIALLLIRA
jgi:hypothetical protein